MSTMAPTAEKRFNAKTKVLKNGCIEWTGYVTPNGYGRFLFEGAVQYAHRVAYVMKHGPIPDGMQLDHKCRFRACVNEQHLRVVTQRENLLCGQGWPAINSAKKFCVNGHPFSSENTRIRQRANRRTSRRCKACDRLQHKRKEEECLLTS